ncbi:hypothetical protein PAPYR_10350 [Paratrimastix pyriformis]|uniref:Uncharacterized protein n=1 Tax=Paratrimastix pyriformis TaxID=342808 RepID=A0ABQ8U663_9EUKA|nr:hypothetical protein PAPYR_10350 [Paratrimastix pyriformis]
MQATPTTSTAPQVSIFFVVEPSAVATCPLRSDLIVRLSQRATPVGRRDILKLLSDAAARRDQVRRSRVTLAHRAQEPRKPAASASAATSAASACTTRQPGMAALERAAAHRLALLIQRQSRAQLVTNRVVAARQRTSAEHAVQVAALNLRNVRAALARRQLLEGKRARLTQHLQAVERIAQTHLLAQAHAFLTKPEERPLEGFLAA